MSQLRATALDAHPGSCFTRSARGAEFGPYVGHFFFSSGLSANVDDPFKGENEQGTSAKEAISLFFFFTCLSR